MCTENQTHVHKAHLRWVWETLWVVCVTASCDGRWMNLLNVLHGLMSWSDWPWNCLSKQDLGSTTEPLRCRYPLPFSSGSWIFPSQVFALECLILPWFGGRLGLRQGLNASLMLGRCRESILKAFTVFHVNPRVRMGGGYVHQCGLELQ